MISFYTPLIHKRYICDGKLNTPMKIKIKKKYLLKCYFYSSIDNGNKKSF